MPRHACAQVGTGGPTTPATASQAAGLSCAGTVASFSSSPSSRVCQSLVSSSINAWSRVSTSMSRGSAQPSGCTGEIPRFIWVPRSDRLLHAGQGEQQRDHLQVFNKLGNLTSIKPYQHVRGRKGPRRLLPQARGALARSSAKATYQSSGWCNASRSRPAASTCWPKAVRCRPCNNCNPTQRARCAPTSPTSVQPRSTQAVCAGSIGSCLVNDGLPMTNGPQGHFLDMAGLNTRVAHAPEPSTTALTCAMRIVLLARR